MGRWPHHGSDEGASFLLKLSFTTSRELQDSPKQSHGARTGSKVRIPDPSTFRNLV